MGWRNYYISTFLFILVLFLAGCSPLPPTIDILKNSVIPDRESVVFGRINVILGGNPVVTWGKFGIPMYDGRIFLLRIGTSKAVGHILSGDGSFYWHLPPGDYSILAFEFGGRSSNVSARIFANFRVPEEQLITYIGKITLVFSDSRYHMNVEDDYEQAVEKFKNKFPEIKGEIVRNLMKMEKNR
jgi:hypothetical protein